MRSRFVFTELYLNGVLSVLLIMIVNASHGRRTTAILGPIPSVFSLFIKLMLRAQRRSGRLLRFLKCVEWINGNVNNHIKDN